MSKLIGLLLLIFSINTTNPVEFAGYYVSTVPNDVANDRFATEYFTIIRPGLSLNGFDNGGNDSKGLGLKQVLNKGLAGDSYIKAKLTAIFNEADDDFTVQSPNDDQVERYSRILQYTAFEALASYVLEHNGIDSSISHSQGLNIRSHAVAVVDLKQS